MSQPKRCPDEDTLHLFACEGLSESNSADISHHVEECAACAAVIRRLQSGPTQNLPGRTPAPNEQATRQAELASPESGDAQPLDFVEPPIARDELGRLGGYRLRSLLGRGGMGLVFHAEDIHLQRPVALKVLMPRLASDPRSRERFLREARAAAGLRSEHVVTIYQAGEDRGIPFLAMELLRGEPLDRSQKRGRWPTVPQALRLGKEIALGLAAAHEKGLIHRDVKPANIWLEAPRGRVKLLDFGLARIADEERHLTRTGLVLGTPAYMSPEQARGETLDARSDLFSLGCVLYESLAHELPFQATTVMGQLTALMVDEPRPLRECQPQVPGELGELVGSLLAKKPANRLASAREVAQALQRLERGQMAAVSTGVASASATYVPAPRVLPDQMEVEGGSDPSVSRPGQTRRRTKRSPRSRKARHGSGIWWVALVVIGCLGLLALGAGLFLALRGGRGTLQLLSDDPNVHVIVERSGEQVALLGSQSGQQIELPAGEYTARLGPGPQDLLLSPGRLTLHRGDHQVISVHPLPPPPVLEGAQPPPPRQGRPPEPRWPPPPPGQRPPPPRGVPPGLPDLARPPELRK
jgi:serine/threonine protein kinase